MADTRNQILARLPRSSLAPTPPAVTAPAITLTGREPLVAQFVQTATANGLNMERSLGLGASRLVILASLHAANATQVFVSRAIDAEVPGLLDAMAMLGVDAITLESEPGRTDEAAKQPKVVSVGLMVAAAGWADSGTVVLRFALRRAALAYIWPPRTFIILPAARLFVSQAAWVDQLRQSGQLNSALQDDISLISGISATRDVATTHVAGVYGANEIRIFLIEPEPLL